MKYTIKRRDLSQQAAVELYKQAFEARFGPAKMYFSEGKPTTLVFFPKNHEVKHIELWISGHNPRKAELKRLTLNGSWNLVGGNLFNPTRTYPRPDAQHQKKINETIEKLTKSGFFTGFEGIISCYPHKTATSR